MSSSQTPGYGAEDADPVAATSTEAPQNATQHPHENNESTSKIRKGKKTSPAWDHFTPFTDEDGAPRAKCNYCGQEYCADSKKNGTTSMIKYLKSCTKLPRSVGIRQTQLSLQPITEGEWETVGELKSWKFDQELCRRKLIEMVIKDDFPFRVVDGEGFKEFVKTLQSKFKLVSRWTISRDCFQMFLDEKLKLRSYFVESGQSVCITTNTWTSLQQMNYMCVTAHYIDKDWKLNKRIINFCTIERHRGEDLGRQLDSCLREWGIARVFVVTVDNASSNDTCLNFLKTKLASRACCLAKGKLLHMRCVAHIIALVVKDGLKEVGESVDKIRAAVKYIRQSPARILKFKECCKEENIESKNGLCLDVATWWNSTYLMLSVACKFEKAFDAYVDKDPFFRIDIGGDVGVPLGIDWENRNRTCELLAAFFELTVRISGSLYITCNEFLHEITSVSVILSDWIRSEDENVRAMGIKMRAKFNKYWGDANKMNHIIFFSIIVDSIYKYEFLEYALVQEWGEECGQMIGKGVMQSLHELMTFTRTYTNLPPHLSHNLNKQKTRNHLKVSINVLWLSVSRGRKFKVEQSLQ